jgi:mono/diheme cytochrome c family protein
MRPTACRSMATAILAAISAAAVLGTLSAQQPQTEHRSWLLASPYGVDNFHAYCSPCHGRDGTGNGPVARALKKAPPDLTTIMIRHNNVFPRGEIRAFIANGSPEHPAHGSGDMPVWGPTFHALDSSDRAADIRLANIVEYISSIQRR